MSVVDERIVRMVFDNNEFASKISSTINSITQLNKATDTIGENSGSSMAALSKAFQTAENTATQAGFHIKDIWMKVASILEEQVAGKIVEAGKKIANAMSMEGIADGFKEYELKMGSVQTILAGTGESLDTVNKYLEELNKYSDQTIYSFADMTNNIGKFTNAGVKLEDAVAAIKGIANEAAISGANANEASRAMYNFSQALSAGYVKLIDWKSIENANMATLGFKETLLEVASSCGTVEKSADGMYKVLGTNAQGKSMDDVVSGTKNFNDSLQYQWMTTEVLTKALKIYASDVRKMTDAEKAAYEQELRNMGLNDAQIKKFEELGSKATDAASEVKTFTMLIDTLKEAIGSGWAQTWEILIGDFEEAKALWTEVSNVLGGFIDKTSSARNEILKNWKILGGRQQLIDGLANSFHFLQKVIQPIGTALREVFPPVTAANILKITSSFKAFTESLKVGRKQWDQIHEIARGFFSAIDIGIKFIKAFTNALSPAGKGVSDLGSGLLDIAANIGNYITRLDESITKTNAFSNAFKTIGNAISPVFDFVKSGVSGIKNLLSSLVDSFQKAAGPTKSAGEILKSVFDDISKGFENLKERIKKLSPLFEGLVSLFKGIGSVLGSAFKQIGGSLTGLSGNGSGLQILMSALNAFLTGSIALNIFNGVKAFKSFGEVLGSFGDILNGFGQKVEAPNLMEIAKAIALLAASLTVVSMIDSGKLTGATAAITTMMFSLAAAIAVMMKAIDAFTGTVDIKKTFSIFGKDVLGFNATEMLEMSITLKAVSKALVSMGAAILMMAIGLKVVSTAAEDGHLWDSFAVVSLMLVELTAVGIALSKFGGDKAVKGLTSMSAALVILAAALKIISNIVADGNAWESLGILTIMLAELAGVSLLVESFGKYKMTGMTALISLAVSLNLCVIALKQVSDALGNEGNRIWESLGIISIMLAELAAITVVMSKFGTFAALGGAGAILAATSLLIMVQALKQVSDALGQTDQHIWEALGVIAASLVVLALGLTAMAGTIPGAAGLLVASAALIVLGGALKIIGSLSLAEIGKGLLAMAGSLVILAAGLTAMVVALPGAIALTVAAAGLTVLAGALKILGSMSLWEIIKALGELAVALLGIAVITSALSVVSPFMLAFSVALGVFGAAMVATGIGLTLFCTGLQSLIAIVPMGTLAIKSLATCLIELIPTLVSALMDALGVLATKIVEYGPVFTQAVIAIIDIILMAIVESALKIGAAVLEVIVKTLQVLADNTPKIAKAGADLIIAFIQSITEQQIRITNEGYKCAIALINGLADAIENNNDDLIDAVDHLMSAVIQAITQWLVEFTPLGLLIPEEMKDGIMSGEVNVKSAMDDVIKAAINAIKGKVKGFKEAAKDFINGFISGLKDAPLLGKVISAAADMGAAAVGGLRSKDGIDSHSDSKETISAAKDFVGGFVNTINDETPEAKEAAANMGNETVDALKNPLTAGMGDITSVLGEFSDVIDTEAIESLTNLTKASEDNTEANKKNTTSLEKNQKQQEKSVKVNDDLSTSALRAEKATQQKTKAEEINVKAMKTSKEQAMALHEIQEKATHDKAKYTEIVFFDSEATNENTEAVDKNTEAKEKNAKASNKEEKEALKSASSMEYASGVVKAFTKQYGDLYSALGDDGATKVAAYAIRQLAEETYNASVKTKEAAAVNEEVKVSIEDMIKTFNEMRQKIYDSVKSLFDGDSFFQKFEVKTEKTMAELLEAMHSNVNAVTDWSAKLVELGNKGLNQGLLKQLAELGPKGYEYVNAFSHATGEQIEEANALFAHAATLPDSISNNVVASYAKAGLNCIQGFANGIDENSKIGSQSIETAATTYLEDFNRGLKENSPSKATYNNGMWLIMGLKNGISNYSHEVHNKIVEVTKDIVEVAARNLSKDIFYGFGVNVGQGLANGMLSCESMVRNAAETLSVIAASVTMSYNRINSPSKLYRGFGENIADGFVIGIDNGISDIKSAARSLSEAVKTTIENAELVAENDMELHPVISPVLDLSSVKEKAGLIGSLFPEQSMLLASSVGAIMNESASQRSPASNTTNTYTYGGANIYITARDGESADQIADRVISKLDRQTNRRKAVYGT